MIMAASANGWIDHGPRHDGKPDIHQARPGADFILTYFRQAAARALA